MTQSLGSSLAEAPDVGKGRGRVDYRRIAAEHDLPRTERREAELECTAAVRGRLEEDRRVQRVADVEAARLHAFELERRAARKDREHDPQIRPALDAVREPCRVGA